MTVSAQTGTISFAPQAQRIDPASFDHSTLTWYKFQPTSTEAGVNEQVGAIPMRLGGPLVQQGTFKQSVMFGGMFEHIVSPASYDGWLLQALFGACTTTADDPEVGVKTHKFHFDATGAYVPWLAMRRTIPEVVGGAIQYSGETGYNGKLMTTQLVIPNAGLPMMSFGFGAINEKFDNNPTWAYSNSAYDPVNTIPLASGGSISLGGETANFIGAEITIGNQTTGLREEQIIGSYRMGDITTLQRSMSIRLMYNWSDDDLYRKILTGTANGTDWSSSVFRTTTAGAVPAFEVSLVSPVNIGATSTPYSFRFVADQVSWAIGEPLRMQGGSQLAGSIVGTVELPDDPTHDYAYVEFVNDYASYAWPTP